MKTYHVACDNLQLATFPQGQAVEIERGLRRKHFPIRVRYILTSDTYAPKTVESEDWVWRETMETGKDRIHILPSKQTWLARNH